MPASMLPRIRRVVPRLFAPELTSDPYPCTTCAFDSVRYFDVVKAADLDLVNANIQANGGKVLL